MAIQDFSSSLILKTKLIDSILQKQMSIKSEISISKSDLTPFKSESDDVTWLNERKKSHGILITFIFSGP